jgi:hypothetical protein
VKCYKGARGCGPDRQIREIPNLQCGENASRKMSRYPIVGQIDLARGRLASPSQQSGIRDRVMRTAKRPRRHKPVFAVQQSTNAVNLCRLDRLSRQPFSERKTEYMQASRNSPPERGQSTNLDRFAADR